MGENLTPMWAAVLRSGLRTNAHIIDRGIFAGGVVGFGQSPGTTYRPFFALPEFGGHLMTRDSAMLNTHDPQHLPQPHGGTVGPTNAISKLTSLALEYPLSWYAPVNPLHDLTERSTLPWLESLGVVKDEKDRKTYHSLAVGRFAGSPFPYAGKFELETIARFLALWIYYDDTIEGVGEGQESIVADAIVGGAKNSFSNNRCHVAWAELGRRCLGRLTDRWLDRHRQRFGAWLTSVHQEREFVKTLSETRTMPSLSAYLGMRVQNIGMYPTIDFIEWASGYELSEQFVDNPQRRALEEISCLLVAIQNDIGSYSKDRVARWPNVISCISQENGLSQEEGFRGILNLHRRLVSSFDRIAENLQPSITSEEEDWIQWLRYIIFGFARWHLTAPRYRSQHDIDAWTTVKVTLNPVADFRYI